MEVNGQLHAPVPIVLEAPCAPELIWRRENLLPLPGFEPRTVQHAAKSLYRQLAQVSPVLLSENERRQTLPSRCRPSWRGDRERLLMLRDAQWASGKYKWSHSPYGPR